MRIKKARSEEGWLLESGCGCGPQFVSMPLAVHSAQHGQTDRCTQ